MSEEAVETMCMACEARMADPRLLDERENPLCEQCFQKSHARAEFGCAVEMILKAKRVSAELLVRKLEIKRDRADELLQQMEVEGFVGPDNKGKRELLLTPEKWDTFQKSPFWGVREPGVIGNIRVNGVEMVEGNGLSNEQLEEVEVGVIPAESGAGECGMLAFANVRDGLHEVPLALIVAGENPRELFEEAALQELAEKIRDFGQRVPIELFRLEEPTADGKLFEIGDGERRVRAIRDILKLPTGPGIEKWERGQDPWHADAFPEDLKQAGTTGPRRGGWLAIDFAGNVIGWVADGTPYCANRVLTPEVKIQTIEK